MDHIANMLVKITNADKVHYDEAHVVHNNTCEEIVKILVAQGYCYSYRVIGDVKKTIAIELKHGAIKNLRRVSKSSLRKYTKYRDIQDVRNGMGLLIISTSQGIMTGREARSKKLGGEILVAVDV